MGATGEDISLRSVCVDRNLTRSQQLKGLSRLSTFPALEQFGFGGQVTSGVPPMKDRVSDTVLLLGRDTRTTAKLTKESISLGDCLHFQKVVRYHHGRVSSWEVSPDPQAEREAFCLGLLKTPCTPPSDTLPPQGNTS